MKQRCNVRIVANIEDIKKEAVKEFEKELSKVLKKWR